MIYYQIKVLGPRRYFWERYQLALLIFYVALFLALPCNFNRMLINSGTNAIVVKFLSMGLNDLEQAQVF